MKKTRIKLKTEILILLILASFVPIIGMALSNYYILSKSIKSDFNTIVLSNLERASQTVVDNKKYISANIETLSQDPNAKYILEDSNSPAWLKKSFDGYVDSNKDILNVYLGTYDGQTILSKNGSVPSDYDPRKRDWYKNAVSSVDNIVVSEPYEDAFTKSIILTYSKTVKNSSGAIIGVVSIDVALTQMGDLISDITLGKNGVAVALTTEGSIIAHKDKSLIGKSKENTSWINNLLSLEDLEPKVLNIDGKNYITVKYSDNESKIIFAGFVPKNEIKEKIFSAMKLPLTILILTILLVIIITLVFSNRITTPMKNLVLILNKLKSGDFTEKLEIKDSYNLETNDIIKALNSLIDDMVILLQGVKEASDLVKDSSETLFVITKESSSVGEEVAKAVQQIAEGTTEEAAELNEGVNVVNKLEDEVDMSLKNSSNMLKVSKQVKRSTDEGMEAITLLKNNYDKNEEASNNVSKKVDLVSEKSNQISNITETIKSITDQTNLLALNASIEAARAGEAGRGFSVVADEVRKLAEESSRSAEEISKVVSEIKESINELYEETKYTKELNKVTGESMETTRERFDYIQSTINELEEDILKVSNSLEAINESKDILSMKIAEIASVSEETAATTEEVSASTEEQASGLLEISRQSDTLNKYSKNLNYLIEKFKIK